jgi:magnesium-transporting ATPase (P-type)
MSGSALAGLTEEEALRRRQAGLGNEARIPPSRTYLEILRRNAFTLVNTVLFGVAALLVWLELPIDALVTAGPVVVYVAIGVWQEARATALFRRAWLAGGPPDARFVVPAGTGMIRPRVPAVLRRGRETPRTRVE